MFFQNFIIYPASENSVYDYNDTLVLKGRRRIPHGDVMTVIDDIVKDYQKEHRELIKKRKKQRRRRRKKLKKISKNIRLKKQIPKIDFTKVVN